MRLHSEDVALQEEDHAEEAVALEIHEEEPNESDQKPNEFHHDYKGGFRGHIFRRVYHIITFTAMPLITYAFLDDLSRAIKISSSKILSFLILAQILLEFARVNHWFCPLLIQFRKRQLTDDERTDLTSPPKLCCNRTEKELSAIGDRNILFGMREYERDQISAQAWGFAGLMIVFLFAFPRPFSVTPATKHFSTTWCAAQIGTPIAWCIAWGDPLIGELKRAGYSIPVRSFLGVLCCVVAYLISFLCFGTPFWLMFFMPIVAVLAEYPSLRIIDDNGMMLLIPLFFTVLFEPWYSADCPVTIVPS